MTSRIHQPPFGQPHSTRGARLRQGVRAIPRPLLVPVLAAALVPAILFAAPAAGADRTKVALTTTARLPQNKANQLLVGKFLTLLEFNASQSPSVSVVERMQLDVALQELVLSKGLNADPRNALQLGKLASAELILNAQLLPPDSETGIQRLLVRIVEARTGNIRGITVAPIDELTLDDSAEQVARYLSAVIEAPQHAAITVAVGAFESAGRFDRLRPLELGVRDMLTTGLVNLSRFRVLQRSEMKDLVHELDLIQAGWADRTDLPDTLPRRAAAYLVTGTLDERNSDGRYEVSLKGKIIHARSSKTVHEFQFVTPPDKLPEALSKYALHIAGFLTRASELPAGQLRQPLGRNETQELLNQVLADLYRFRRQCPIDFSPRTFRVPGVQPVLNARQEELRTLVTADSVLGTHLLRKSIDRLESILFIQPENAVAMYALGFCYAHHIDGIWQPERGEVLLRTAFASAPGSELGANALTFLSEMSYHHQRGRLDPKLRQSARTQLEFAFENMPEKHRARRWVRMMELLRPLQGPKDIDSLIRTMDAALTALEQTDDDAAARRKLTLNVGGLASSIYLSTQARPRRQDEAGELLKTWADGDDQLRRHSAALGLAKIAMVKKDHAQTARWYRRAADNFVPANTPRDRIDRNFLFMQAARYLRRANRPEAALEVLKEIDAPPTSLVRGYRDVEAGICLELLGRVDEALETWVTGAEMVPYLAQNSDVVHRILAAGGVPLRPDRDIDVRYVSDPNRRPVMALSLATDGSRLFCADLKQGNNVQAYDISTETWKTIGTDLGRVTCLAYDDGDLWVGTDKNGLWRCHLIGNDWQQWSSEQGLPDQHVESITLAGHIAYVGVGTQASGGLVRIDEKDAIHVFESQGAPPAAPTHVVVRDDGLLARTLIAVYEYDASEKSWKRLPKGKSRWNPAIYQGETAVWASRSGNELYVLDPTGEINDDYKQAWFPRGQGKAGYLVKFLIERDGQIWFGGSPWARFKSMGLYRVDKETGEFHIYGPRDGFLTSQTYDTYDGVWAADRLWLATTAGLAEVTPRKPSDQQPTP